MANELRSNGSRLSDDDTLSTATSIPIDPDLVARRAYERYRTRGGAHGQDQQDWFEAERELIAAQMEEA
jgi:hypothetical protein